MSLLDPIKAEVTALSSKASDLQKTVTALQAALADAKAKAVDPAEVAAVTSQLKAVNQALTDLAAALGTA